MSRVYVERFLEEIKDKEKPLSKKDIKKLETKGEKFLEALYNQALFIHDPGTYATLLIVGGGPVYLDSFFQTKSALKMVLSFIQNEDSYLDIPESEQVGMTNYIIHTKKVLLESYGLFKGFFERSLEGQEYILCAIKNNRKMYSENEVRKALSKFSKSLDDQINYLSCLRNDFKRDMYLTLYFGTEKAHLETDLEKILSEKSAEKAVSNLTSHIQQNFEVSHSHINIFRENGFKLFDYLMKNHLSIGSGSQSDIAFYYRRMEYDGLIHAKQTLFKKFLDQFYPDKEPIGKMKSLDDVKTEKREQAYRTAKNIMGLK